ncbi:MAG: hypothetical protein H0X64_08035, partial [Gemmatimonadaceae bacterium]|nr:hypothetical protein [Gemmatimonadaceae bacterium]
VALPPATHPLSPAVAREWAGVYADGSGENMLVVHPGRDALEVGAQGQGAFAFVDMGTWRTDRVLDSLNARAREFARLSRAGQYDALAAFIGRGMSSADVARSEATFWQRRDSTLGAYGGARVVGTRASGALTAPFPATTLLELHFARGTTHREFIWDTTRSVIDYGTIDAPLGAGFRGVSARCVASFNATTARSARMCLEGAGDRRAMVIHGAGTPVTLLRAPGPGEP